jgi:hypothetical protein
MGWIYHNDARKGPGMRICSNASGIHAILFICITYYLAAGIGADFVHTHECDAEFHDNCPACQWLSMSQDDFSGAISTIDVLAAPLNFVGYKPCAHVCVALCDSRGSSSLSRAPPLPA